MVDLLFKKICANRVVSSGSHEPMDFDLFLLALKAGILPSLLVET
jgi:hypothetical protein